MEEAQKPWTREEHGHAGTAEEGREEKEKELASSTLFQADGFTLLALLRTASLVA